MERDTIPPGGWQWHQPQSGWSAPTPVGSTFDQTVTLIIKHRRANPAMTQQHKLSLDPAAVAGELETYTARRLGLPDPKREPPPATRQSLSGAVVAAVDNVKKLAAGAALLLDWEQNGEPPVASGVAAMRAATCAGCPKNGMEGLVRWFTEPVAERIRKQLGRLHEMKLTTPSDAKLGICTACLCELKLKCHTPSDLILKRLTPEKRAELNQENPRCWQLDLK